MADAITTESYVWTDSGTQPQSGDESYVAGEQPIAEYDNWAMWALTTDIDDLNAKLGNHSAFHESGGQDEINLDSLNVGTAVQFVEDTNGSWAVQTTGGNSVAVLDQSVPEFTSFPDINDTFTFKADPTIQGGHTINVAENTGSQRLVDMSVTGAVSAGTEQSYSFAVDGQDLMTVYAESDGAGGVQNTKVQIGTAEFSSTSGDFTLSNDLIATDGEVLWDESNTYIPQGRLQNESLTVTAGDGLKDGGTVALGSSTTVNVEPVDFAGDGLEDDGSDNLQIVSGGVQLRELDVSITPTWTGSHQHSANVTFNDNIRTEWGTNSDFWGRYDATNTLFEFVSADIDGNGTSGQIFTVDAGSQSFILADDLEAAGGETIWDESAGYIPQTRLQNTSVTYTAGDGLSGGGSVALGGSTTIGVEPADFAGTFLSDDGSNNLTVNLGNGVENDGSGNLRVDEDYDFTFTSAIDFDGGIDVQGDITDGTQVIWDVSAQEIPDSAMGSITNSTLTNSTISVTAGDGIKGGGNVSLGGSTTVNIEPADFAGDALADDGSDNLQIASSGVQLRELDQSITPTWTGNHTWSANIVVQDDNQVYFGTGQDVWYRFDSANNELLFMSNDVDGAGTSGEIFSVPTGVHALRLGSDLQATNGEVIWDESAGYVPESALQTLSNSALTNSSVTVTAGDSLTGGGSISLGGSTTIDLGTVENSHLSNSSITVNAGTDVVGGGTVSLGGSISVDHADTSTQGNVSAGAGAAVTDVNVDGRGHVTSMGTTDFDSRYLFESGDTLTGNLMHNDGVKTMWGSNEDFSAFYDSSTDELVIKDETNGVELIRQPKSGSTQFLQGADIGSIEAPEDSLTQLINASNTSATTSGTVVGYTFAVDSITGYSLEGTSSGSGGLSSLDHYFKNTGGSDILRALDTGEVAVPNGDLTDGTNIIYDQSNAYIPQGRLQNDSVTVTAGDSLTGGGTVALGSSTTIDLGTVENTHLANTTITVNGSNGLSGGSAALGGSLTVSISGNLTLASDLVATNGEVIWDESNTYIPQSRLQNDSVTINTGTGLTTGGSVALGGSVTVDHADTSTQGNVSAAAGAAITGVNVDGMGHVTSMSTTDFDGRFVNTGGDTMSGTLTLNGTLAADMSGGSKMSLPQVSSDPAASAGEMWYRTDLD